MLDVVGAAAAAPDDGDAAAADDDDDDDEEDEAGDSGDLSRWPIRQSSCFSSLISTSRSEGVVAAAAAAVAAETAVSRPTTVAHFRLPKRVGDSPRRTSEVTHFFRPKKRDGVADSPRRESALAPHFRLPKMGNDDSADKASSAVTHFLLP